MSIVWSLVWGLMAFATMSLTMKYYLPRLANRLPSIASDMVAVCKNGKWGYVDLEGNERIAPAYEKAKSFSNGFAAVSNGKYWGFINADGALIIDYLFFGADYFNLKGCCMVETEQDSTWQLISLYNKR